MAVSGDEANDLPRQVETLIARLRQAKHVDFHNDWKLVNLFIGGNDRKEELSRLKGEYDALEQAAIQKNCPVASELKAGRGG